MCGSFSCGFLNFHLKTPSQSHILALHDLLLLCNRSLDYNKICLSKEEFEDTKGIIRIRKSKNRQHNGQRKKDKQLSIKRCTEN